MTETSRFRPWLLRRVAIVSAVALAGGGLLVLEQTGPSAATGQPSHVQVKSVHHESPGKNSQKNDHGKDDHGKDDHGKDDHGKDDHGKDKHCDDGHGKDKEKNKHCRPPSGH